jgi:hypothetical protein
LLVASLVVTATGCGDRTGLLPPELTDAGASDAVADVEPPGDSGPFTCPGNETFCTPHVCADLATSDTNCGACGHLCPAGTMCSAGVCGSQCVPPFTVCSGPGGTYCTNLTTDPANCSLCGETCFAGQICTQGDCECPPGETLCVDKCTDTATDPANCGGCGNACPPGVTCEDSACLTLMPVGEAQFTTPGTFTWIVPAGVTAVSVLLVGGGGGGSTANEPSAGGGAGGALCWANEVPVTPGQGVQVVVGSGGGPGALGSDSTFGEELFAGGGGAGIGITGGPGGTGKDTTFGRCFSGGHGGSFIGTDEEFGFGGGGGGAAG